MQRFIAFVLLVWCSVCWANDRDYIKIPSSSSSSADGVVVSSLRESFPGCIERQTVYPDIVQTTACYEGYSMRPLACSIHTEVTVDRSSTPGQVALQVERVSDPCPLQGHCEVLGYQCVEGPETRMIDGVPVHQACWRWDVQYQCVESIATTCSPYMQNQCKLLSQNCISWSSDGPNVGKCDVFEYQYQCPVQASHSVTMIDCGGQTYQTASGRLVAYTPPISLSDLSYEKVLSVSDNSRSLMPTALNMSPQRRTLDFVTASPARSDNCHVVGARCTNRIMGICTQIEQISCCSASRIGLAANEYGRFQLNKGWGTLDDPKCGGFTQEEWVRIDWSLIDTRFFQEDMQIVAPPQSRVYVKNLSYYDQ